MIFMKLYFYIGEFLIAVVLVLLYYKFVDLRNIKKFNKNNIPTDVKVFIKTQKVNMKKMNYKKIMRIVTTTNAINIGLVLLLTNIVDNILLKFVIAIPAMLLLLYLSYNGIGLILKKKGMTEDES